MKQERERQGLVQRERGPEEGGECRKLIYDGIMDGCSFRFKVINKRVAHVLIIVMVRLHVA